MEKFADHYPLSPPGKASSHWRGTAIQLGAANALRLGWIAWPLPVGRAVRACGDAVRAGGLARQAIVSEGQEAGRA